MKNDGIRFFEKPMMKYNLNAVVTLSNNHSCHAAMAKYPVLNLPADYRDNQEPVGVTFITRPFHEQFLYQLGALREHKNPSRVPFSDN